MKKTTTSKKFEYTKDIKRGGLVVDKSNNIYSVNNIIGQNVYATNIELGNTSKKKLAKLKGVKFFEEKKFKPNCLYIDIDLVV